MGRECYVSQRPHRTPGNGWAEGKAEPGPGGEGMELVAGAGTATSGALARGCKGPLCLLLLP